MGKAQTEELRRSSGIGPEGNYRKPSILAYGHYLNPRNALGERPNTEVNAREK